MLYTKLGNTGLVVSRIALGTMTFGSAEGKMASVNKLNQDAANQIVNKSLDAGINFFNCADVYAGGESEEIFGRAIASRRRDVIITTKGGMRNGGALIHYGLSRQHVIAAAEASLRRLNTDYIDLYLAHTIDPSTPIEETVAALDLLVQQGKIRYSGFSNWPAWMAAKAAGLLAGRGGASHFRAAELYYSLVGRDAEYDLIPFIKDAGIGMLVWSPLAGGFLTGRYTRQNPTGSGGRLSQFDILPYDREKGYTLVEHMQKIAATHKATVAQIALAWLLAKPYTTSLLIGASSLQQLDDNINAVNVKLSPQQVAELDDLTALAPLYPHWFNRNIIDATVTKALNP